MTEQSPKMNDTPAIHQSFVLADVAPRVAPLDMPRQVLEHQDQQGPVQSLIDTVARLLPRSA